MTRTIVIAGAGHAGGRMALSLREEGFDGKLILVGNETETPYERPPLSKEMLTGEADDDAGALADEAGWKDAAIDFELGIAASEIDTSRNTLLLADGRRLGYDHLVLATGSRPRRLSFLDRPDLPTAVLRTRDDARWIRERVGPGAGALIVGAGVIGLEAASSIVKTGGSAIVLEAGPGVMGRSCSPTVGAWMQRAQEEHGVEFRFGVEITSAEATASRLVVSTNDGSVIKADFAVVGIGVLPNEEIAASSGIAVDRGIVVDGQGRTSCTNVWAVGDVARHPLPGYKGMLRQETWRHADTHPRLVARAILGGDAIYDDVPGFWSDQFGLRLQIEGRLGGEEVLRPSETGHIAFYLSDGVLTGAAALNQPKIAILARRAIAAGARLDARQLADPLVPAKLALKPNALKR